MGCQNVVNALPTKSSLRTNETFVGYEDGDITKKVEVRVTGVLKDIKPVNDIVLATEGQKVNVKNVGEKIKNPVKKLTNSYSPTPGSTIQVPVSSLIPLTVPTLILSLNQTSQIKSW